MTTKLTTIRTLPQLHDNVHTHINVTSFCGPIEVKEVQKTQKCCLIQLTDNRYDYPNCMSSISLTAFQARHLAEVLLANFKD